MILSDVLVLRGIKQREMKGQKKEKGHIHLQERQGYRPFLSTVPNAIIAKAVCHRRLLSMKLIHACLLTACRD